MLFRSDVDFQLDVEGLNQRWSDPANIDNWSQLVLKHTYDTLDIVTHAPPSGVWRMAEDGTVHFAYTQTHRRSVEREDEAFFLSISKPGDYRYEGADLGILITPGRLMTDRNHLNKRAKDWIRGILAYYNAKPVPKRKMAEAAETVEIGSFKML